MEYRNFGKTGLKTSLLGFGDSICWISPLKNRGSFLTNTLTPAEIILKPPQATGTANPKERSAFLSCTAGTISYLSLKQVKGLRSARRNRLTKPLKICAPTTSTAC